MSVGSTVRYTMKSIVNFKRYSGVNRTAIPVACDAEEGVTSMLDQGCSLS